MITPCPKCGAAILSNDGQCEFCAEQKQTGDIQLRGCEIDLATGEIIRDIPATNAEPTFDPDASATPLTDKLKRSLEWWRDCFESDTRLFLVDAREVADLERRLLSAESALAARDGEVAKLKEHVEMIQGAARVARKLYEQDHQSIVDQLSAVTAERDEARREFHKAAEWNQLCDLEVKNLRSLVQELGEDAASLDLMADEFARIKALTDNAEIHGLCERAVSGIKQSVPIITQRDTALAERDSALRTVEELRRDGERLAFILKHAKEPNWQRDWPQAWKIELYVNVSNHEGKQPSIEEDIDSAIAAQNDGGKGNAENHKPKDDKEVRFIMSKVNELEESGNSHRTNLIGAVRAGINYCKNRAEPVDVPAQTT